ncbi:MAG: thioesterase family protein [Myxococcota bacterium]|nr:thioesterase family protein [Myxococcota bacterium]
MQFSIPRTVRFGECDPAGAVYYPVFFNWFHELMECWFEDALGLPYRECLQTMGFPAKETGAEFFKPCTVGEELRLQLFLSHLGKRSLCMEIEVFSESTLKAKGFVVCVCIGLEKDGFRFSSKEIPTTLRDKMMKFLRSDA